MIPEYDAITTVKFPSLAAFKDFMDSPESQEHLVPDGPRLVCQHKQKISIGTEWEGIKGSGESRL